MSSPTRTRMVRADASVSQNEIWSPALMRRKKPRTPVWGALWVTELAIRQVRILLDQSDCFQFLGDNFFGQARIVESFHVVLALGYGPSQEADNYFFLLRVGYGFGNQQPRKGRNGICALAGRVDDRDTEVGRHGFGSARRR